MTLYIFPQVEVDLLDHLQRRGYVEFTPEQGYPCPLCDAPLRFLREGPNHLAILCSTCGCRTGRTCTMCFRGTTEEDYQRFVAWVRDDLFCTVTYATCVKELYADVQHPEYREWCTRYRAYHREDRDEASPD